MFFRPALPSLDTAGFMQPGMNISAQFLDDRLQSISRLASASTTSSSISSSPCPAPVLSRLVRHRIVPGETVESIARQYNLLPATLQGLNPSLRSDSIIPNSEILIPPFNGIRAVVPPESSWREVAAAFGVRADVLFEVNGCQQNPDVVFVPGVNWAPTRPTLPIATGITGYPLPAEAVIALNHGWHIQPDTKQVRFHSGIDLLAAPGTDVLAAGNGTVAFVGEKEQYGIFVVVNHSQGRQTRYAHLTSAVVTPGQPIKQGDVLGTAGTTGQPDTDQPHLHFEVRYNSSLGWVAEDPEIYFRAIKQGRRQKADGNGQTVEQRIKGFGT